MSGSPHYEEKLPRVAVLGLGAMGLPMARRLAPVFPVIAFDVDPDRRAAVPDNAVPAATPADAAADADVVVLAVRDQQQVEAALFGDHGAVATMRPDTVVVLTSTVGPEAARRTAERLTEHRLLFVDAPVSGGPARSGAGDLLIVVGADEIALKAARPVLERLASTLTVVGPHPGDGQSLKTINQLLAGVHIAAAAEAVALARGLGLDAEVVVGALSQGAASSFMLADRGPRMLDAYGDGAEVRSRLDIFVKDMGIVSDVAGARTRPRATGLGGTATVPARRTRRIRLCRRFRDRHHAFPEGGSAMNAATLLMIAAAGIAVLLVLVIKVKLQPFVALVVVSLGVALAAGVPPADLVTTIQDGMGATLGYIATIIALGAMIGRIIELSGGARALAESLIDRFGERRTPLALTVAGFVLGIPVFFDVGLIILLPIAAGAARVSRKPLLVFALPMAGALLAVHAFLPPHPGAVAAAALLGADQALVLLIGLPITAVVIAAGYLIAKRMTRREYPMAAEVREKVYGNPDPGFGSDGTPGGGSSPVSGEDGTVLAPAQSGTRQAQRPPSFPMVLSLIGTPIVLMLLGAIGKNVLAEDTVAHGFATVLGAPMIALLIALALCGYFLGVRRGWSATRISEVMSSALPPVALVILVSGAGGVFGKVLVTSGIGDAVADVLRSTGLPLLVLAFLIALLLRMAQGSATVALVAGAGLLAPLLSAVDLSAPQLALVTLAMGGGALAASHINDSGFWMFTKLAGLEVSDGLRTWTVLTTAMGVLGFALTAVV